MHPRSYPSLVERITMANRRWLIPIGVLPERSYTELSEEAVSTAYCEQHAVLRLVCRTYDFLSATFLGDLYDRIAREILVACSRDLLTSVVVGTSSPPISDGRARLTDYWDRYLSGDDRVAARHAEEAGLGERLRFQLGDVESLPFPDEQFDLVVSTLSLHHWQHPSKGLQEIFRVLKPGGQARILDLPDWVRQNIHGYGDGRGLAQLAAASPFGRGVVAVFRWPGRLPTMRCLWLRREG